MYKWSRYPWVAIVWLAAASACGLVESDSPTIELTALDKQFAIDATAWSVDEGAARAVISQSCVPNVVPDPCAAAATALSACKASTCSASCNEETAACELSLHVELWRAINLSAEVPEFVAPADDGAMLKISLDDVTYEVTSNQLSVATPELAVYVAPSTVMGPTGDGVQLIGTIASVPAETDVSEQSLRFTADGKDLLRRRLSNYQVPFNLIVGAILTVDQVNPIPVGKVNTNLRIHGRASL